MKERNVKGLKEWLKVEIEKSERMENDYWEMYEESKKQYFYQLSLQYFAKAEAYKKVLSEIKMLDN